MAYLDNNLPAGTSGHPDAPWNEEPPVEVPVVLNITVSKPVILLMPPKTEYTQEELFAAAKEQVSLDPVLRHWDIDDFAVVEE